MIRLDCEQGDEAWHKHRCGRPTASAFDQIITKTGKPSASAERYKCKLIAEWLLGESSDADLFSSEWMIRGTEMEDEAVRWYEFNQDREVDRVGFVMRDDRKAGCSPDGLVGDDTGLEIKCPSAANHVMFLLGAEDKYRQQVQGSMWICERSVWHRLSYNPVIRPCVRVFERDDKYISVLEELVMAFAADLEKAKEKLLNDGYTPAGADQ